MFPVPCCGVCKGTSTRPEYLPPITESLTSFVHLREKVLKNRFEYMRAFALDLGLIILIQEISILVSFIARATWVKLLGYYELSAASIVCSKV